MLILWNRNNKFSLTYHEHQHQSTTNLWACALGPNFVSLILSFCSLYIYIYIYIYFFFSLNESHEVQIMHTWSVRSSWTPFFLFLIQMGNLFNVLSKCTNFGSFCAMIKRKKKFLSNWEMGWFNWEVLNVYFLSSLVHIFSSNLVSIEHNFLLQIIEKHA